MAVLERSTKRAPPIECLDACRIGVQKVALKDVLCVLVIFIFSPAIIFIFFTAFVIVISFSSSFNYCCRC